MNPQLSTVARSDTLYRMLRTSTRDRLAAPANQPFAFCSDVGRVRRENQDNAMVLTGRRAGATKPFLAAIVCDGMGGLEAGDDAADLAIAAAGSILCSDEAMPPELRMRQSILTANRVVFDRYRGRAGAVFVAILVDKEDSNCPPVIGWVGDARAYGLQPNGLQQLTRDDTVAAQIEALEGSAPEAMNQPLQAIGTKAEVRPNIVTASPDNLRLLLVSDGVHRLDPAAMHWIRRYARNTQELVERLVEAANWQEGVDNATALAIDLKKDLVLDEEGPVVFAWVGNEPRVWQTVTLSHRVDEPTKATPRTQSAAEKKAGREGSKHPSDRKIKDGPKNEPFEQAPLIMDLDDSPRKS